MQRLNNTALFDMALIFDELQYKNFLSTGNKATTINLNQAATTLVVGDNGSGKSTMLDALSFCLFGKAHRNINKPQLVNSINGKGCLVTVKFHTKTSKYEIIRGIKPNIFEIYKDGKLMNQESHTRDYQKILEQNVLKMNHKTFHQVIVLGSSNFVPFMKLIPRHRREVSEDFLDISIFGKMAVLHKDNASKNIENAKQLNAYIRQLEEKIKMQKKHLTKLRDIREADSTSLAKELKIVKKKFEIAKTERDNLQHQFDILKVEEAREKKAALRKNMSKAESSLSKCNARIDDLNESLSKISSSDTCHACKQKITDDTKNKHVQEHLTKIKENQLAGDNYEDQIDVADRAITEVDKVIEKALDVSSQLGVANSKVEQLSEAAKELSEKKSESVSREELDEATLELEKLNEKYLSYMNAKRKLSTRKRYNDVISELLKDTGIKSKIIKQYIDPLNTLINKYLLILDFFVLFNIDENFNETIRSRHRDDFSYDSFSEGEKQRIDLALLFAWRQISKMKNSVNTNLLILDETFDSSLDANGVDNLLKILATLPDESRVFVISHKRDLLEGKFDRRLEFEKAGNFSKIRIED